MKIALTGASGQIDVNLCRHFIKQDHHLRVLVHRSRSFLKTLPVEAIEGDVNDPPSLARLLRGVDVVFHLAALISIRGRK